MKKLLSLVIAMQFLYGYTQEKIEQVDREQVFQSIEKFASQKEYDKLIESIDKVSENDSLYYDFLVTKSYYLMQQEKFEEAIEVTDQGIYDQDKTSKYSFFLNKGIALIGLEKYKEAIKLYDEALIVYPKNYLLHYNKAVAYENLKEYDRAVALYKQTINLNPFFEKAHLQLGKLSFIEHKMTQALMCFNMYLVLNPDGENSFNFLKSVNQSLSVKNTSEAIGFELSVDDESFEDIDDIISSQIALNKQYKSKHKIDIALTRQNQAMLEQLDDFEGEDGFWSKRYVPFFKWIVENDLYDSFTYTINYSIKNEKYQKLVTKHTQEVKEFINVAFNKWIEITSENEEVFNGEKQIVTHYLENKTLKGIGKKENNIMVGYWEIYNDEGRVFGKGHFDSEGKRKGEWLWYDDLGRLTDRETYVDGELTGPYTTYYKSGKIATDFYYKKGKLDSIYKAYNSKGALVEEKVFGEGELNGVYKSFYPLGEKFIEYKTTYKEGEIVADVDLFYANGDLNTHTPYKNGSINGELKEYYRGNKIREKRTFIDGVLSGKKLTYYVNEQQSGDGEFIEGEYTGTWKTYYKNGTLKNEFTYNKGKLDGIYKEFTNEGKLFEEFDYRNGLLVGYRFYNSQGKLIKEGKKKKGEFYYEGYSENGTLITEGLYDVKGGKTGLWKYYTDNGVNYEKINYVEDELEGENTTYYNDGVLASKMNYKGGLATGYFESYYHNGQIKRHGWYNNLGQMDGLWKEYFANGVLNTVNYYYKGELNGEQKQYGIEGEIYKVSNYEFNKLLSEQYFKPDGKLLEKIEYPTLEKIEKFKHHNEKLHSTSEMMYGIKHGKHVRYAFDGTKIKEGTYFNDEYHGKWVWYTKKGKSKEGSYLYGDAHGDWKEYHENKTLKEEYSYEYGNANGIWKSYNDAEVLIREHEYIDNEKHGKSKFFSHDGNLQMIRYYKKGRIIGYSYLGADKKPVPMIPINNETGEIKAYFDNGKVSMEIELKNGDFVNSYVAYFHSGKIERKTNYVSGMLNGEYKRFYSDGTVKEALNYKNDRLDGTYVKYYKNGKVKEKTPYIIDVKSGEASYYDQKGKLIKKRNYFNNEVYQEEIY